jgi:tetratricopeptide (TPR) repeat protein
MTMRALPFFALIVATPFLTSAAPLSRAGALAKLTPEALMASGCGFAVQGEGGPAVGKVPAPMPLVEGLAPIHYPVSTTDRQAQAYFDQGMALLYGFEFPKAERSFAAAVARDPSCGMCKWGQALAIGPYINSGPSGEARIAQARDLTTQALAAPGITAPERALIEALAVRYAPGGPPAQKGVHAIAFADAMQAVSDRWPADDMIMVLAAEAAMNVRPWDYWEADNATPRPWTRRALALVEKVLARNPDQTEAQHLYIHLTEASTTPGRAERAADRLEVSSPASAHLVHMPSHTYYRIGRFADGVDVNRKAIVADEAMARRLNEDPTFYGYFTHHTHFILSSAEQIGDRATALKAAADLEAALNPTRIAAMPRLQSRLISALQARAQFAATLDELLAIPQPDASLPEMRQMWWALRAEGLGRAGRKADAMREIVAMRAARGRRPIAKDQWPLVKLAETIALARIAEGSGQNRKAVRLLTAAAGIEAKFTYNEPPLWHQPVDAALGALLLRTGNAKGAKLAFDRALVRRPGNGWALWGKAQAEAKLGDPAASARTLALHRASWKGGAGEGLLALL